MTDQLRQAAQQALEAWDDPMKDLKDLCVAMDDIRTALEQQAEPVARKGFEKWAKSLPNYIDLSRFEDGYSDCNTDYAWAGWQAAQRPWQGLTDEAIWQIATDCTIGGDLHADKFARAIEAKLKEQP